MPDYHPIDVRYKGPSTSYRGSAKRGKSGQAPKTHLRETPAPWGSKAPVPAPQQDPKATKAKASAKAATRDIGLAQLVYLVLIGTVVLLTLSGGPSGVRAVLGFEPAQMNSLP